MSLMQGVQGDGVPLHNAAQVKIDFRANGCYVEIIVK